nr:hypothetical protein [uncultured bacterium]
MNKYKQSSQEFCQNIAETTTGNKLVDYYVYHYGDQFTAQEIIDSSNEIHGYSKESFYIEREEGETFGNYLKRLRATKFDEKDCLYDKDLGKFRAMNGYIPALYGVFEFFHHIGNLKDNVKTNLLMNDLLYFSYFYGKKYMLEMLGFVNLPLVDNDTSIRRISDFGDPEKHRIEFILDNLVYPGLDFNVIASGSDEEVSRVLDVLKEDEDAFMEQLKYFNGFGEQIREYYSSGRE